MRIVAWADSNKEISDVTLALPPLAFRMQRSEFAWYVLLAFSSSPAIHAAFSFFAGWHEYMPFWHIPFLWDLGG